MGEGEKRSAVRPQIWAERNPVNRLLVRLGAGKFELGFSVRNPEPMDLLEVSSGAAGIELENLALRTGGRSAED